MAALASNISVMVPNQRWYSLLYQLLCSVSGEFGPRVEELEKEPNEDYKKDCCKADRKRKMVRHIEIKPILLTGYIIDLIQILIYLFNCL